MSPACAAHPQAEAAFRCDGCGALLCAACIEEGHRLLFCRRCGERALPLADGAATTAPARRREELRARAAAYRYSHGLLYPFRGYGAFVYWGYVALLTAFSLVAALLPFGCLIVALPELLTGFLVPGLLFAIVRTTAEGADELPDWPEVDPWEIVRSVLRFAVLAVISLAPLALATTALGCAPEIGESLPARCLPVLLAGFAVTVALWIPAFGATAVFDSLWLSFRVDLHWAALRVDASEFLAVVGLTAGILVGSSLAGMLLSTVLPGLGLLAGNALSVYGLFVGAHMAGVYFRRHFPALERVYLG